VHKDRILIESESYLDSRVEFDITQVLRNRNNTCAGGLRGIQDFITHLQKFHSQHLLGELAAIEVVYNRGPVASQNALYKLDILKCHGKGLRFRVNQAWVLVMIYTC
jgi:hypothetical protein